MKQYLEQANIDTKYEHGFNQQVIDIEERLQKLRGSTLPVASKSEASPEENESEDEEILNQIIEKVYFILYIANNNNYLLFKDFSNIILGIYCLQAKAESFKHDDDDITSTTTNDELPFCEICNEDAEMRCLGCQYLFCKICFKEHKDDDDGCNRYEPYKCPKNS